MMTPDKMIEVLEGLKEEKIIEVKYIGPNPEISKDWYNPISGGKLTYEDIFGLNAGYGPQYFEYRVAKDPVYRPFKSIEEVLDAIEKHGSWIIGKDGIGEHIYQILSVHFPKSTGKLSVCVYLGDSLSSEVILNNYKWGKDGTPCGILVE